MNGKLPAPQSRYFHSGTCKGEAHEEAETAARAAAAATAVDDHARKLAEKREQGKKRRELQKYFGERSKEGTSRIELVL
jgi:hypothetical protein